MENGEAVAKETLRTVNAGAKADKVAEMEGADDPPPPPELEASCPCFRNNLRCVPGACVPGMYAVLYTVRTHAVHAYLTRTGSAYSQGTCVLGA